ncbi:hypothetical protein [Desulfonatronum sp. SC1]|uniref:hypothetical protein n=1 Tax=Desulfonatronum sp. SC1 TaxID=2109626 RepID=UPI000D3021CE|nr:hypothetical protein [Desulfonatronum sp. SC1]PTN37169.1 hypothetical protein C6366_07200 [Desulfonatronum sp. SC1]
MFEQQTRGRDETNRHVADNAWNPGGRNESEARTARLPPKADYERELRQAIKKTLSWFDYWSRFPKN